MLNTFKIGANTQSVSFNAPCTGIIQKSHPKSRFKKFHHTSDLAKHIFSLDSAIPVLRKGYSSTWDDIPITVLQLMAFGDGEFICEYVFNSDVEDENKDN